MFRKIILLLFITIGYSYAAQDLPDYIRAESKQYGTKAFDNYIHHHKQNRVQEYGDVERRNYDVLRYDLYLDLHKPLSASLNDSKEERKTFTGDVQIEVELLDDSGTIEFDAGNMEILKVGYIENVGAPIVNEVEYTYVDGIITIQVPDQFKKNDIETFSISYKSVADDFQSFVKNRGMHIYHKGLDIGDKDNKDSSVKVEHNIAYSMSEPELARYWMPCNDRPYDKALSSITLLVPKGYTAIANGTLTSIYTLDTDSVLTRWDNYEPITTYLMNFAASIFDEYSQTVELENDTITMLHYAWPEDMYGEYFKLIPSMQTHPQMMEKLTENYGPYPFSRYGTITVYPFPYGGMEHQTNVTQNRFWIRNNGDFGFVHEMGHHWFGDMMTCATWADVWINEGGATFTEAAYFESIGDETDYRKIIEGKIKWYLYNNQNNETRPMYAVPLNTFFSSEGFLIYEKGAIFLNQMRLNLGNEQFFKVIKEILQEYKYKSITTDQYKQAWKEKAVDPLVNIDLFFDQWVYGAGNPEYTMETDIRWTENDKYILEVNLNQVQDQNPLANVAVSDLFITPIRFEYTDGTRTEYSELFLNDKKSQEFSFETEFIPTEVKIDLLSVVHQLRNSVVTTVELDDYVGGIEIYPNPATDGMAQLNMNMEKNVRNASVELVDILGNKVRQIFEGPLGIGGIGFKIFTNDLASGIYLVNINIDGVSTSKKLVVQ